jgi:ribose transport system permease protein
MIAYGVTAVIFIAATLRSPEFAFAKTTPLLLTTAAIIGIASIGQTFVILGGGLDLSVPWIMTGSAIVIARLANLNSERLIWLIPITLVVAGLIGWISGTVIARLKVSPIIMTLGMAGVVEGGIKFYTQGKGSPSAPAALKTLAQNVIGPFTWITIIWVVLAVIATVILAKTSYGRGLYATGTNSVVSRFSGVRTDRVTTSTYVISAVTASLGGILLLGFLGDPSLNMGTPYLFATIAAVAIGGASIAGGSGNYIGTVAGALLMVVLIAFLRGLPGFGPGWQGIVYGVVILVAVALASGRFSRQAT